MPTSATIARLHLKTLLVSVACVIPAVVFGKPEWDPIPAEDLAALECKAFPGASAEALVVAQLRWNFGAMLSIVTERLTLELPLGFTINQKIFGPNPPASSNSGNSWTWTSTNRPYRPAEPYLDPTARNDADLLITLNVPAVATGSFPRSFGSWQDVTAMYDSLNQGQCDSSPELAGKVHRLTASCSTELEKIRVLGTYVQKIRYVEINPGLRYGFGWKARKASSVFSNGYGDCKDKTNLLIAMLREAGIHAHRVVAMADPNHGYVAHPEFPSPMQFNHAIAGIEVEPSIQLPAVVETEKSGRLLFFDPTDPYTQVGDLPAVLQGTNVHVSVPGNRGLTLLPRFDAERDFLLDRQVTLTLSSAETGVTAVDKSAAPVSPARCCAWLLKKPLNPANLNSGSPGN